MRVYYFGSWNQRGHLLYTSSGRTPSWDAVYEMPVPLRDGKLDGAFAPKGPEQVNIANHFHIAKWTVIAFWDRSGDSRPGSNSAFVMEGDKTFEEALMIARAHFPEVMKRIETVAPITQLQEPQCLSKQQRR